MLQRRHASMPIMVSDLIVGVLVPEDQQFRFIAVDRRFRMLDGSRFRQAEAARLSAVRLAKAATERAAVDPGFRSDPCATRARCPSRNPAASSSPDQFPATFLPDRRSRADSGRARRHWAAMPLGVAAPFFSPLALAGKFVTDALRYASARAFALPLDRQGR